MTRRRILFSGIIFVVAFFTYKKIDRYFSASIRVDNKTYTDHSFKKKTVQTWLESFNIQLSSQDLVVPALDEILPRGQEIQVTRVREVWDQETDTVFTLKWKRRMVNNLRPVELQNGTNTITTRRFKRLLYDEQEVAQTDETVTVKTVATERLALFNERGFAEKIYDLSSAPKMQLTATAYWLGDPQVPGDTTYSGHKVERGLVAVDPKVIPLHRRLYIPGYGYAYSSDTGSAIKGRRIDLFVSDVRDSHSWEFNKVVVYVLEKSRTW